MFKTIRNFFYALYLTIQGRALKPPETRYPNLHEWVSTGRALILEIFQQAEVAGLTETKRRELTLPLEGRTISVETILAAVRHNLTTEYPMLMDARIEHNLTTLYAINMNDRFRVSRLSQSDLLAEYSSLVDAIERLNQHLMNIPSSQNP
ncbi:MAG: hypothetical protein ACPG7F_11665 [Aggregatilineales bacterium]